MSSADSDPLFELRNLFLIGNYQAAINEGLTLDHLSEQQKIERDALVYRSYVAKGDYNIVLEEIKNHAPVSLLAVKCLASYMASERNKDNALASLKQWLSDYQSAHNDVVQVVAATIFLHEENFDEVFRALHHTNSLEA